jgi:hypothetical protein
MSEDLPNSKTDDTPSATGVDWRRCVGIVLRLGQYYCVFLFVLLLGASFRRNLALVLGVFLCAVAFYVSHRLLYRGRARKKWIWLWHLLAVLGILFVVPAGSMVHPVEYHRSIRAEADLRGISFLFEWYKESHGHYPPRLQDVEDLLPQEQRDFGDPFGDTYKYRKLDNGKVAIYSLGPDRDDDGAQKEFDRASYRYSRTCSPFRLMPGFIYNLTYESTLADIDGDICLFLPYDPRKEYERLRRDQM